ncbi:hypothetical protein ElyMa_004869800 [Elysia marginata]|uniref:Uncharacterized protein n=1 Tax=Elysia marginata TaxID=1093978 RepID=A0AAV4ISF6_9GAST|nr:hypothetical protein ElyMa_004869800 [Elysia marginata]
MSSITPLAMGIDKSCHFVTVNHSDPPPLPTPTTRPHKAISSVLNSTPLSSLLTPLEFTSPPPPPLILYLCPQTASFVQISCLHVCCQPQHRWYLDYNTLEYPE